MEDRKNHFALINSLHLFDQVVQVKKYLNIVVYLNLRIGDHLRQLKELRVICHCKAFTEQLIAKCLFHV